jgi:hypothetical protein
LRGKWPISCQPEFRLNWLIVAKLKARSEASRQKTFLRYFDGKLRFALLASFRSDIFSEIQADYLLATFPARVKISIIKFRTKILPTGSNEAIAVD